MRFVEGCDFEELSAHLDKMRWYRSDEDRKQLKEKLDAGFFNLIAWRESNEVVGHAIWHETSTGEDRKGDPRDREDRETLERLSGGRQENLVELHGVGLMKGHRGKGYGRRFFEFFEKLVSDKGYSGIVYYAFDPAAIAICRERGYREEYGLVEAGPEGEVHICYTFYLALKKSEPLKPHTIDASKN
jgi:GNAT superfamily N-acetyltransferase